jgi:hypothetical protein
VRSDRGRLVGLAAVLVAVASLVGGCADRAVGTAPGGGSLGTATPSTAGATAVASIVASPSIEPEGVELTEADRGRVVSVDVGTAITVVLHSTYWSPATTSDTAVVDPTGDATVTPASPGTCLPGIGCGTVTSVFVARASGEAVLTAGRTVCGEALNCKDTDKTWTVDIHVGG